MDFTREPVVETVITPREGCKLVVRSSKGMSQEEYFVDSVEVVSFGAAFFYRALEKPKNFFLPVVDYEVLEVREARMVLKHTGTEKSIKIAGGKKKEEEKDKEEEAPKRGRRRTQRKKRTREDKPANEPAVELPKPEQELPQPEGTPPSPEAIRNLLKPPPLISETIVRYKEDETFSSAFYEKEEAEKGAYTPPETVEPPPIPEDAEPQPVEATSAPEGDDLWNFSEDMSQKEEK